MDTSQNSAVAQPTIAPIPPQPIPVSDQTLTLDPNQMVVQPVMPPTQNPTQQVATPPPAPQYPVSGPHKEAAPIIQAPVAEYVRPTEVVPQLHAEVQEAGVEVVENKEQPQLTADHKAVGLEPAKESVPVTISQTPSVPLPYTYPQVKELEKTTPVTDSKHWLAALTEYLLRKLAAL